MMFISKKLQSQKVVKAGCVATLKVVNSGNYNLEKGFHAVFHFAIFPPNFMLVQFSLKRFNFPVLWNFLMLRNTMPKYSVRTHFVFAKSLDIVLNEQKYQKLLLLLVAETFSPGIVIHKLSKT